MENQNLLHKVLKLWFRQKSDGGLEAKLGYRFKDPELLAHALVHRSFLTGTDLPYVSNNERLEFLGDSVLNMLTTEYLYKTYPDDPEGELSKRKSAIVSGADAYEAVLGAVYLDGGLEEVRAILNKFHFPRVQEIISAEDFINHKSELLEYLQGKLRTVPEYIVVDESGPEHQKVFTVEVHVNGRVYGRGQGGNKKKAEQEASRVSLEMLLAEAAKAEAEKGPEEPKPKKQKQRHVGLP